MRSFKLLKPLAFALVLSFTSSQVFAFTPVVLPLTNASLSRSFVPIQNLQSIKDSRGLESLGVNPQLSSFLGNIASGAVIGGMSPISAAQAAAGVTQATMIQASVMQTITLQGVGRLGLQLGLDSGLTNIIGLSIGAIQGNIITNPGTALEAAFNNIKPQLFSSLAQWGITKLGAELGIDNRITGLVALPLGSAINAKLTGESIVNSIMEGALRGGVTVGVEFATQKLDPLVGALTARAVTGAIAGGLSKDHDIFKGIFNAYAESTGNLLTLDGPGNNSWSQALYLSKIQDFSKLIQEKGFAKAFETYATSIFYRDSVEDLIKVSGSVLNYFQTALTNPQSLPQNMRPMATTYNGQAALFVPTGGGDYLIVSADGKKVFAQSKGAYYYEGVFGVDEQNGWVLTSGTASSYADTGVITLQIDKGALKKAEFQDYNGKVAYEISGQNGQNVIYSQSGELKNAVIKESLSGSQIVIQDGQYLQNRNSTSIDALLTQSEPWYQKFSLSKTADFTDQKIDQMANWILGDAQDSMGWVLGATAVNSSRDIIKGAITDTLRFGSSLPGALDDFSNAWQDAKDGKPLSAGYKALLGSGKILQEIGRATVLVGVFKGLATSVARAEGASLKEALTVAKATGKKTTVIGHAFDPADTKVALEWPDHNILNLPKAEYQRLGGWEYNKRWLDDAISRGDEIFLATDPSRARAGTTFARELEYLKSLGFVQEGAKMVRRK